MPDETLIDQEKKWFYEERAKVVVGNLQKRNINAQYVPDRQEALRITLAMIPQGAMVSYGDSVSLVQIGIIDALKKQAQFKFIDPLARTGDGRFVLEREERYTVLRKVLLSDVFLMGTNAVTVDGKLVNIDGVGNRVAALTFGPKKVILIAGINKIVKDVNEALERIHGITAPLNAMRHYLRHHMQEFGDLPCVRTGRCIDCSQEWRICNHIVITEGVYPTVKGRINVVLVGEELGL